MFFCNSCCTFPQFFSGRHQLLPEPVERGFLFGAQDDRGLVFFPALQFLNFLFGLFQALLQDLFFLTELHFRFLLNGPDQREGREKLPRFLTLIRS